MKKYKNTILLLIVAAIFLWASNEDYKDYIKMQTQYCEMVSDGYPNYKNFDC